MKGGNLTERLREALPEAGPESPQILLQTCSLQESCTFHKAQTQPTVVHSHICRPNTVPDT